MSRRSVGPAGAAALGVVVALVAAVTMAEAAAELVAGAASIELAPPAGVPLAGYGAMARRRLFPDVFDRAPHAFWFRASAGSREPLMARALLVEAPGDRILWIAVDLVAVDDRMVADVSARLAASGLRYSTVIVSASHTHSGPGAFIDSALFAVLALDRFDTAVRDSLVSGMVDAATRAERGKTAARLGLGTETSPPAMTRSRLKQGLDPEIVLLKLARADGAPIALLWNFAIHGTVLGARNLKLSGDVMGVASRAIEARIGAPALFVNGAVGDVSPAGHGEGALRDLGERLAGAVVAGWRRIAVEEQAPVALASDRVELGPAFFSARNCLGRWTPSFVSVSLGTALPSAVELTALRIGRGAWVTVPGELQTSLGLAVKEAGRRRFDAVAIAGLSNGYVGYLLAPDDYRRPSYVSCASLYGEGAGQRVAAGATALLERLGAPARTTGTVPSRPATTAHAPARTSCGRRCSGG